jgi:hypothetical protein
MSAVILIVVVLAILLYYMYTKNQTQSGTGSEDGGLTDLGPIPESIGGTGTAAPSTGGSGSTPSPSTPTPPPPPTPPSVSGSNIYRPGGQYSTNNLANIVGGAVGGGLLIDEVLTRVMEKKPGTTTMITAKVSEQLLKSVEKPLQNLGAKIGGKIGAKLISLGKSAGVAGVRAGAIAAKAMAGAALGPAFIAEMAFALVAGTMDGMNLGGFANFKTMKMLDTMRDSLDEMFKDALGEEYPWVYGPLDDMDKDIFKKKRDDRVDAYFDKKMNEILDKIPSSVKTVPQLNAYVDAEVAKMNEETMSNEILAEMCAEAKGSTFTKPNGSFACSYTKDKCVAKWPVSGEEKYYEWNDNSCQVRPVHMRKQCEGMGQGVTYNMSTGSCNLTKEYCGRYAGSAVMRGNDCVITEGQDIAEAIFGRTITRSIVNIFDFKNNYEKCSGGMTEANELIAVGLGPLTTQFFCSGAVCPAGQEMMMQTKGVNKSLGGLCYKACDPGFSSNWAPGRESAVAGMCYKDCPAGWRGTTEECVRDPETKSDYGVNAKCPDGNNATVEGPGGMCEPDCPSGYKRYTAGGLCMDENTNGVALGQLRYSGCPDGGYRDRGLTCTRDASCKTFWRNGTGLVTQCSGSDTVSKKLSCGSGYEAKAGGCYAKTRPLDDTKARPLMDIGECPKSERVYSEDHTKAGQEVKLVKSGGKCYLPCDWYGQSYHRTTPGLCQKDYDSIKRTTSVRQPTKAAYSVHKKKRLVPFPSTSEDDFKNSPIGKQIQRGINGVRDGNPEEIGKAFAGYIAVANPAVLITNTSEVVDADMTKNNRLT